jgi:DNA-binding CsgD family transcriptional regulator
VVTSPVVPMDMGMSPSLAAVFDVFRDGVLTTTVGGWRVYSNPRFDTLVGTDGRVPQYTSAPPPYVPPDQYGPYRDLLAALRHVVGSDKPHFGELELVNRRERRRLRVDVHVGALAEPGRTALVLWVVRPLALARAATEPARLKDRASEGIERLTRRELDVLGLLLEGWRVASIARSLYVSEHTVRNHLKAIYRKLGTHSQQELIERMKSPVVS